MITVRDVYFSYSPITTVLKGVTFSLERGRFVAIVGPNGSGKSTFAKLLNGLLLPSAGEVTVDGFNTKQKGNILEIRKRVGVVFQNPENNLVGSTVEEDIAFGPENLGLSPEEIQQRVEEALGVVEIETLKERPPHMLSGGQKQKVAIAGMLAMHSSYLVLDEATSMLDTKGKQELHSLLLKLNREKGLGVVLITHDMEEAVLAEKIAVMYNGQFVLEGTPREVFSRSEIMEQYGIALPPVARLAAALRKRGVEVDDSVISVEELVDGICRSLS